MPILLGQLLKIRVANINQYKNGFKNYIRVYFNQILHALDVKSK